MNNGYGYQGGYPVAAAPAYGYGAAAATTTAVAGTTAMVGAAQARSSHACACCCCRAGADHGSRRAAVRGATDQRRQRHLLLCGSTWFTPAYVSGRVAYLVTTAPPGH